MMKKGRFNGYISSLAIKIGKITYKLYGNHTIIPNKMRYFGSTN